MNNNNNKVGRNQPCTCGSGMKYKRCCLVKEMEQNQKISQQLSKYENCVGELDGDTITMFDENDNKVGSIKTKGMKMVDYEDWNKNMKPTRELIKKIEDMGKEYTTEEDKRNGVEGYITQLQMDETDLYKIGVDIPFLEYWCRNYGTNIILNTTDEGKVPITEYIVSGMYVDRKGEMV